jgi:hypothetical protein
MSALGHSRPSHFVPVLNNIRYASDSDHSRYESELALWAKNGLMHRNKHQAGPFPRSVSCTCRSSALLTNSTESIAAPSWLREYKTGVRHAYDATMAEVLQPVDENDLNVLAHFLAHAR